VWTVPGDTLVVTWTSTYHWDPQSKNLTTHDEVGEVNYERSFSGVLKSHI